MEVTGDTHIETRGTVDTGVSMLLEGDLHVVSEATEGFEMDVSVSGLQMQNSAGLATETWNFTEGDIALTAYDKSNRWSSERSSLVLHTADSSIDIFNSEGHYSIEVPWTSWRVKVPAALTRLCAGQLLQEGI